MWCHYQLVSHCQYLIFQLCIYKLAFSFRGRAERYYGANSQYTECFRTVIQLVSTQSSATNVLKKKPVIETNPGTWRSCGSKKNKTIYELFQFIFIFTSLFCNFVLFSELTFLSLFLHQCFSVVSMPVTFLKRLFQCPHFSKPHALTMWRAAGE